MSSVRFHDSSRKLSAVLVTVAESMPPATVSLRELLSLIGEQGLLLICAFLSLPFLIPVSIPGVSTVFGLAIILIGIGVTLNRVPWLPRRILDRPLSTPALKQAFEKGAGIVARFERWIRPRWPMLTRGTVINFMHGAALVLAGVLLMFPLGLVPFSNTLPGIAILLLSLGIIERDGLFIAGGYVMIVVTIVYFTVLAMGAMMAGQGILGLFGT
jgi:hypothetical protein